MVKLTKEELLTKSVEVLVDMVLTLDGEVGFKDAQLREKQGTLEEEQKRSQMYWKWYKEQEVLKMKAENKISTLKGLLGAWE